MKIIICGAGQVGGQIARHLAREEGANNVTVIDNDPALVRRLMDGYDIGGIAGFASHPDVLEQAGARDADMIIAATQSDEVNMVVCQVAHSIFSVPRKIARLRSQAYLDAIYADLYRTGHLPIDVVISPEISVADAVMQRLNAPAAFDIEGFLEDRAQLVGMTLDASCAALYTPLRQLSELFSTLRAVIVGLRRKGRLAVVTSDEQLKPGDQIYALVVTEDMARFMEAFGKDALSVERALIIGGGNIGLRVAQTMERLRPRAQVKLIERDRERAETAAEALRRAVVLRGDGLDLDLLREANVAETDAMVALTEDDKTNLLACVRAKAAGAKLVIALLNDQTLVDLVEPIGIDAYVNPRSTTVSSILRYVRHGRIRQVYSIGDGEAEVIEAQVLRTSALAGRMVREAEMPEDARIGVIRRGDKVFTPRADTRLAEGDELTIFAMRKSVADVERLFQVGFDFF
ncbi:Trk system potassium transporter TrkA [Amaricoccus solimangrovi]|uniref:Trk system potassium uptake protein TrkA n=1 Tax=Amaricoccus solimangrovi TaxID=2589815 RepID=A0A501WXG9_9RHOB|nr:Trk system potassium transporter TrkA [Amaricoccus solimangrovi]TPE53150.1 Trk system potassium transporter TrkA [Amaricoccus solimangrovi]